MDVLTTRSATPALRILGALARYHYLTAAHVTRLFYPRARDHNREAQRRLKTLVDAGYVLRLPELSTHRFAALPHVFTLSRSGWHLVSVWGYQMSPAFRRSDELAKGRNNPFIEHTLATTEVLVAIERLSRQAPFTIEDLVLERELRGQLVFVDLPVAAAQGTTSRKVAVIPDAWVQVRPAGQAPIAVAVELDRATHYQRAWRRKIQALVSWAHGPYKPAFATTTLTVAVVTPSPQRRDQLRLWTLRELELRQQAAYADIFLYIEYRESHGKT
jgi:Replication-relaxation